MVYEEYEFENDSNDMNDPKYDDPRNLDMQRQIEERDWLVDHRDD